MFTCNQGVPAVHAPYFQGSDTSMQDLMLHLLTIDRPKHIALAMQRRLSSANRAPSKSRRPPPDINLPTLVDADGNQMVEVEPGVTAPRDAVMAAEGAQSAPGCLSLFNTPGLTSKRFVRMSKPAAGSSLTVSLPPTPSLHTHLPVSNRKSQICPDALRSLRAVLLNPCALDTSRLTQALSLAHHTSSVCQVVGKLFAAHICIFGSSSSSKMRLQRKNEQPRTAASAPAASAVAEPANSNKRILSRLACRHSPS